MPETCSSQSTVEKCVFVYSVSLLNLLPKCKKRKILDVYSVVCLQVFSSRPCVMGARKSVQVKRGCGGAQWKRKQ